jgi:hypothetical protein
LLTSWTCISPNTTEKFIPKLRVGTQGLIVPAGSTLEQEPDAP